MDNFHEMQRFFALSPEGMLYSLVVEYPQVQRSYEDICGTQFYEKGVELEVLATTDLEFSSIQVLSGTVVYMQLPCDYKALQFNNSI